MPKSTDLKTGQWHEMQEFQTLQLWWSCSIRRMLYPKKAVGLLSHGMGV